MAADKAATGMSPLRAWTGSYAAMAPLPSSWGVSSLRAFGSTPLPLHQRTSSRATGSVRTPLPTDHSHMYASSLIVSTTLRFILYSGRALHAIARPRRAASKKMQIIHESFLHRHPTPGQPHYHHRTSPHSQRPRYWHVVRQSRDSSDTITPRG